MESWEHLTSQLACLFKLYSEQDKKSLEIEPISKIFGDLQKKLEVESKVKEELETLHKKYVQIGSSARSWKDKYDNLQKSAN